MLAICDLPEVSQQLSELDGRLPPHTAKNDENLDKVIPDIVREYEVKLFSGGYNDIVPDGYHETEEELRGLPEYEGGWLALDEEIKSSIVSLFGFLGRVSKKRQEGYATEIIAKVNGLLQVLNHGASIPVPPLPSPDPSGKSYPLYQKRTNALEHLREHWGQWLKYFTPSLERDYLHQDELRKLDNALVTAVHNQGKKNKLKLKDIIPPKKVRIDSELKELDIGSEVIARHYRAIEKRLPK